MESRHGADFALACFECEPSPPRFGNAFPDAEKGLRGRAAKANQDVRIGQFDLPQDERQANLRFLWRGRAVARRAPGTMLAIYTEVRSKPIAASMRSSNLPERPTEGQAFDVFFPAGRFRRRASVVLRIAVGKNKLARC